MGGRSAADTVRTCGGGHRRIAYEKNSEHPAEKDIRSNSYNFWREASAAMIWSFTAAFLTGIFASLGVGGGMILIIYLTVFAGFDQLAAQGINLIYFIPIALLSVVIHTKNKLIEWKKIIPAIVIGVAFAALGTYAAERIGSPALKKIFAVFILLIGIKELLFTKGTNSFSKKEN